MMDSEQSRTLRDSQWVVLVQTAFMLATATALALFWSWGNEAEDAVWLLSAFFTFHFFWGLWSWHALTGRWIDAYTLFFISLCLFNGGQVMLNTVGLSQACSLFEHFSAETAWRTLLLVNAATIAFHFAGLLVCACNDQAVHAPQRRKEEPRVVVFNMERVRLLGLLFVTAGFPTALYGAIASIQHVVSGGYMALYQQDVLIGVGNWRAVLAQLFVPGVLLVFAASHQSRWKIQMCWGLMLTLSMTGLFLGTRAAAVVNILAILILHDGIVCRIRRRYLFAACLAGCCLLPLIAAVRGQQLNDRYAALSQGLGENAAVLLLREMGGSAATIAYTIDLVPTTRDYDYGGGYFYGLITAVPNVFGDRHPTADRGTYTHWLIWNVDPAGAENGGSLGYSIIAEAYANFARFGPPVVLVLLGACLASVVSWVRRDSHPFKRAIEAILLTVILVLPRAESAVVCRNLAWFCVIPYFVVAGTLRAQSWPHQPPLFAKARGIP